MDRVGIATLVSGDWVTEMLRELNNTETSARFNEAGNQPEPGMRGGINENASSSPSPNDPGPAKYAAGQTFGHRG